MSKAVVADTAEALLTPGKGLLAADESTGTITKRFDAVGLESTAETRRSFRELLFSTPDMGSCISGVILFEETLYQSADDGTAFPEVLTRQGVIPGIKVDKGAKPLAGFPGEQVTEGLDGLRERLAAYRDVGARFAKWRAVAHVSDTLPSDNALWVNAHALARYAALCQEAEITPVVEPEVLMDGAHSIERCDAVSERFLNMLYVELKAQNVLLEGMLLKPNMVMPGKDNPEQASAERVAETTIACFRRCVPAAVPGIVFLSGGQPPEAASAHLDAINRMGPHPWTVSFSFSRALHSPALDAWRGDADQYDTAQQIFRRRAINNAAAARGEYSPDMEVEAVS